MAVAHGHLQGDGVVVEDAAEANRLHQKGWLGTPRPGNTLHLHLVEAAYAVEQGRLEVRSDGAVLGLEDLLAQGAGEAGLEVQVLAYRDLRERGLVVRPDPAGGHLVWRRGQGPKAAPWFRQLPVAERDPARVRSLMDQAGEEPVLSIVDEEGSVTHYHLAPEHPLGQAAVPDLPRAEGVVLADRVLVTDAQAADAYHRQAHMGTPYGPRLVLSFTEAEWLRRRGDLRLPDDLPRRAAARQHHFDRTWPVYEALRAAGVVPRSGFRFGTHLRAYRGAPDAGHAQWLFQAVHPDDTLHWSELSRGVRLAHGVRKRFCLAVASDPVRFLHLEWFRP